MTPDKILVGRFIVPKRKKNRQAAPHQRTTILEVANFRFFFHIRHRTRPIIYGLHQEAIEAPHKPQTQFDETTRMTSGRSGAAAISVFRIALGLLILASIVVQFTSAAKATDFSAADFFGFFTIISNLFAAVVLLLVAGYTKLAPRSRDVLRGAAVLSLAIVGLVFSALLANLESNMIPWVNIVLHYVAPAAIVLDWLLGPPRTALTTRDGFWWLALPFAYIVYTLVRGSAVHWYPYPFLNVDLIGYGVVSLYCIAIFALALVLAVAFNVIGNRLRSSNELRNPNA